MTIEISPQGVSCNLSCTYCYQNPLRDAGNFGNEEYSFDEIIKKIDEYGDNFVLFGGEALLTPKEELEKLFSYGYEKFGRSGMQTNGVLMDDEHIEIFKKYNVNVGFSLDGWGELNDLRWSGTLESTREGTQKTLTNIEKAIDAGISVSAILTLHKINVGTEEKLESFERFLYWLDGVGVNAIRLHDLEVDNDLTAKKHVLPPEENKKVFLRLAEVSKNIPSLKIDVFNDVKTLLFSHEEGIYDSNTTCTWNACDPYTTKAVQNVNGDGSMSNCGRTAKEGINWVKGNQEGFERYVSLYQTPQEDGGCKDCRFFSMCKGQCPGGSIDGDWRNRSSSCDLWKSLFSHFEKEELQMGRMPLSVHKDRKRIEQELVKNWREGKNASISSVVDDIRNSNTASADGEIIGAMQVKIRN